MKSQVARAHACLIFKKGLAELLPVIIENDEEDDDDEDDDDPQNAFGWRKCTAATDKI